VPPPRPTASSGRTGGDDPLCIERGGGAAPAAQGTGEERRLRLIDVEGFDLSACGGTHVSRTGAIGVIAVRAWERFKGGTRLTFVCGGRALRTFEELRDVVEASARRSPCIRATCQPPWSGCSRSARPGSASIARSRSALLSTRGRGWRRGPRSW